MATRPTLGIGELVGGGVGLVIVLALIASPLYLGSLQNENRKLDSSAADGIERVRRVVLNLDESLVSLNESVNAAAETELALDAARIDELVRQSDKLIAEETKKNLDQSTQALKIVDSADEARGTKIDDGTIQSGTVNPKSAAAEVKAKHLTRYKSLLADADRALADLNKLGSTSDGPNASNHLGTNRIKAIYEYAKGRIERNRACFEAWQAEIYRSQANTLVDSVARLQRIARVLSAESSDDAITEVAELINVEEGEITRLNAEIAAISQAVTEAEGKIGELEEQAALARRRMAELEAQGAVIHDEGGEYSKLAETIRITEAAADAMRYGTLVDANRVQATPGSDMIDTRYEGGTQQLGVRDLRDRLEQRQEQLAGREKLQTSLKEQRSELVKHRDDLKARAKTVSNLADSLLGEVDSILQKAAERHKAADQAAEAAAKALDQSRLWAVKAVTGAKERQSRANQERDTATELDNDRIKFITDDRDIEAAMTSIIAECAYNIALVRAEQMDWVRESHAALADIAARTGRDEPPAVDTKLDDLRKKASEMAATSRTKYEELGKLMSQSAAKISGLPATGKDMQWQAQMGEAAARLLLSALAESDDERKAEQNAAYDLLKQIVEGREQSPAVQTALNSYLLLQETAK